MTTVQMNEALIIFNELESEADSKNLTVDKLNKLFESNQISAPMYASFMKKIGAKDQITDQRALNYFSSVSSFSLVKD